MQKNWYAVYTKPQCEKRVVALLTKKKIESFCPLNCVETQNLRRHKLVFEPLFRSYVFVFVSEAETEQLKKIDGVVNLLFWLGKPAIIKDNEIAAIKEFNNNHRNIILEKTLVNINDIARNLNTSSLAIEGKLVTVKNKTIKINLPTLGYTMIAKIEEDGFLGGNEFNLQNKSFVNS